MLRRKLLTILFVCILLPVLLILFQSATTIISQRKMTTETSGRYVRNLAYYAADRWNEGNPDRTEAFLSLVADQGYDMFISVEGMPKGRPPEETRDKISMKGKFVPGMVAYVTLSGNLISHSKNAAILKNIFDKALKDTGGRIVGANGHIVGSLRTGDENIAYVAYIAPTEDPRVYAIAAVTMLSWMGKNDFDMIKLAAAGIMGMLICLIGLFLLRGSVIAPLQTLSSQVDSLKWGVELPTEDTKEVGDIHVEEISSLKKAVYDLASRMIEKTELENRYVGDIIKAQEDERSRIAQDIHDGPIQVLSALIQRIQIASLSSGELCDEARSQLATAEDVAEDLVQDLRDICDSLVPPWVSLGLTSCMEEVATRFERQHSINITTNIDQDIDLPQETTLALFRIFQEAVSNAVRHGHAKEVALDIRKRDDSIDFSITDNGNGFELSPEMMDSLMREGKRGLNGMKQRIELLGGIYEIHSQPGRGTQIDIKLGVGTNETRPTC